MPKHIHSLPFLMAATAFSCAPEHGSSVQQFAVVSGAIFTTTATGDIVDANIYSDIGDVYLDGGPPQNAPPGAAGLPEGDYYFQVTDPGCMALLSTDDIACRSFHVDATGVISAVNDAGGCEHNTGLDVDHDATTVQLAPYSLTPNPGNEYKVWVTPVADYESSGSSAGGLCFGFSPPDSKTDNYKVIVPPPPPPACGDGTLDAGEQCDDGNTTDGDGCSANCTIETPPPRCGDGTVDAGEQCDDGNTADGDGCSANCTIETPPPPPPCCGNGTVEAGEQCDDGNTTSGDGCSSTCQIEEKPPCP